MLLYTFCILICLEISALVGNSPVKGHNFCNTTAQCKDNEMCCPSDIHVKCPNMCEGKLLRVTQPGFCPRTVHNVSRQCNKMSHDQCSEDGHCYDGLKCCRICEFAGCIRADTTDRCLQPEKGNATLEHFSVGESENSEHFYYDAHTYSKYNIRGECKRCGEKQAYCKNSLNRFATLADCENNCSKPHCDLFDCQEPLGLQRGETTCKYGFRFDANGCYACNCETRNPCIEKKSCTKCKSMASKCARLVCPYEAVCLDESESNGLIPSLITFFIVSLLSITNLII